MRLVHWLGVALALSVAIGAAGCGGGGSDTKSSNDVKRQIQPQAQHQAESTLLQLADFPTGWTGSVRESNGGASNDFRQCAGIDFSNFTVVGKAQSQDFGKGRASASSETSVFESPTEAEDAVNQFARRIISPQTEDCVKTFLEKDSSLNGATVGDVNIGELRSTPPPTVEEAHVWQIDVPLQQGGLSIDAYIDVTLLRQGEVGSTVETGNVISPFDPALRDDLVTKVAARMAPTSSSGQTNPAQSEPTTTSAVPDSISDGIWQYGIDFQAGTYVAPGGKSCYWATLKNTNTGHIIDNGGSEGQQLQQLGPNTPFFQSDGCGTWTKRG